MNIEDQFVKELRQAAIHDNLHRYANFIRSKEVDDIKNPSWKAFVQAVRTVEATESSCDVLRQVMTDVVANVLAILDGSSNLQTLREDFDLSYNDEKLPRTLAETFWEQEQESG